jgi:hypothetical protein
MLCIRGVDGTITECPTLEKVKALGIHHPDKTEIMKTSIKRLL